MTKDEIIKLARETLVLGPYESATGFNAENTIKFANLVAQHEREVISDEWWSCYQLDLENGVKSLNEYEAKKFAITYPELAKFGAWLETRGQA